MKKCLPFECPGDSDLLVVPFYGCQPPLEQRDLDTRNAGDHARVQHQIASGHTRLSQGRGKEEGGMRKKNNRHAPQQHRAGDRGTYAGVLGDGGVVIAVRDGGERAAGGRAEQRHRHIAAVRVLRRG